MIYRHCRGQALTLFSGFKICEKFIKIGAMNIKREIGKEINPEIEVRVKPN